MASSSVKIILAFPPEAHAKLSEVFKDKQFRRKHIIVSDEFNSECTDVSQSSSVEVVLSDNVDRNTIVYRALVASIAKELTWNEIYEVAFIWSIILAICWLSIHLSWVHIFTHVTT